MNGKILNKIPISGTNIEKHFGEIASTNLWIEFENDNYEKWYASFAKEYDKGFNTLIIDNINNTAFISAGAQGYLIDLSTKELLLQTEKYQSILSAIYSEKYNLIIFSSFWKIYIFNGRYLIKEIKPVDVDGIYFTDCSDNIAFGHVEEILARHPNIVFELNLLNFELKYHREKINEPWGRKGFEEKKERDKNKKSFMDKLKSLFK